MVDPIVKQDPREVVKLVGALDKAVRDATEGYNQSATFIKSKQPILTRDPKDQTKVKVSKTVDVRLDLRDTIVLSAIADLNVFVTSSTGFGKTTFFKAATEAMFGPSNVGFLRVNKDLSQDVMGDVNTGAIKDGAWISEAVRATQLVTAPACILDEANRAPAVLTNVLLPLIDGTEVTLPGGKKVMPGSIINGSVSPVPMRYHWAVGTANEGYVGTCEIDPAFRRRFAMELPLNNFPLTESDLRALGKDGGFRAPELPDSYAAPIDQLFRLAKLVEGNVTKGPDGKRAYARSIPADPVIEEITAYLGKKDQCYATPIGTKLAFDSFNLEICKGCPASAVFENVCGNVFAPPPDTLARMERLATAYAIYRVYKQPETPLYVTNEDLMAVAPFVLYKKMPLTQDWVTNQGGGSSWYATSCAMMWMMARFTESANTLEAILEKESTEEGRATLSADEKTTIKEALRDDPSCRSIEEVQDYWQDEHNSLTGAKKKKD